MFDAHVVDNEQVALSIALHGAVLGGVHAVLSEIIKDIKDGAVEDDFSLLDQLIANGLCKVALAHSGGSDQQYVFGLFSEQAAGELVDLLAVDAFVEAKIKAFECAFIAEGGAFGAPFDGALLADVEFVLKDEFEELFMCEIVADGFLKPQVETGGKAAQTQLRE